jgi:hypothetical protein
MYYTLIGRTAPTEPFQIIWGSYDPLDVEEELAYHDEFEWFDLTIVGSGAHQDEINLAVAKLNGGRGWIWLKSWWVLYA